MRTTTSKTFGEIFKKLRLQANIQTLKDFGNTMADYGYVYEDSIFSHWQSGRKIPTRRDILLTALLIFKENNANVSVDMMNAFLASANQGYLTESEIRRITTIPKPATTSAPARKLVDFLANTAKSKKIVRTGWVMMSIKDPESVAEHSFQLSIWAMTLAEELGVNKDKLIQMAIMHDLCETITGDLVWSRGSLIDMQKRVEKEKLEKEGVAKLFKGIGKSQEYVKLFDEMIARSSQESRVFWQLDKLEMAMQALAYEQSDEKDLEEFFINTELQVHHPLLKKILKEIQKQRPKNVLVQKTKSSKVRPTYR